MTTFKGGKLSSTIKAAKLRTITFSGTAKVSGSGVVRKLIGYKISCPDVPFETTSNASGNWSLTMPGGTNDFFRIICVGITGENSEIYEGLTG